MDEDDEISEVDAGDVYKRQTYINDQLSFTNRIYQMQKNPWSLCCYKGEITVSDVQVSTY